MTDSFPIQHSFENQASQHTFLEDFFPSDNNVGTEVSDGVELGITVPNTTDGLSTEDYYKQAVKHLKTKNAGLTKLRLRGGYIFKAEDSKSADALKNELNHLTEALKTIDKVVNAQGIRLRRLVLTVVLGFDKNVDVNVSEILKKAFPEEEHRELGSDSWSVPFKIEHGRGVLKLSLSTEQKILDHPSGRSRYFPVNLLALHMGPGPMLGSASYDPKTNKTSIWSAKTGAIELEGNHMDSEELEEYLPRNFQDE